MIMKIKCWAKLFSFIAFVLLGYSFLDAVMNPGRLPVVNSHVSEGVYTSTTNKVAGTFFISTYPATLHTVIISSYGSSNASFQFFDASRSTSGQPEVTSVFDGSSVSKVPITAPFNITTSSGLALVVTGTDPADITVVFRVR